MFCTDVKVLDELTDGGFPERRVSGVFGLPNIGKSLLLNQVAMKAISKGKSVLYVLTPSEYDSLNISKIFFKRFNTDKLPDTYNIQNAMDFGRMFDMDISIDRSKDKTSVQIRDLKRRKNTAEFSYKDFENYDLVIVDSFSEMLKLSIVMELQNLGARSTIETQLFGKMTECMNDCKTTFILVHHASQNPMVIFDSQTPFGGPVLMYLSKYLLLIKGPTSDQFTKYGRNAKRVQRYRWTGKMLSDFVPVLVKENYGYVDVEENVASLVDEEIVEETEVKE